MLKKEIFIYTLFIVAVAAFTMNTVLEELTGEGLRRLLPIVELKTKSTTVISSLGTCTDEEPIANLEQAEDPHLQKLARYQKACQSLAVKKLMIFTSMPKDDLEAKDMALAMAKTLQEFADYSIIPLVIVEPTSNWGLIDFEEFDTGFFDDWIITYFRTLKEEGIDDNMMGIWVPFPEANLPLWNNQNTSPEDFAVVVNRYLRLLKSSFPTTHTSILLNSTTYETSDFNWQNGEYVSLLPYVEKIDKELISSMGIQGFPWLPMRSQPGPGIVDPAEYLNSRFLTEAAKALNVSEVWFNTGTFGAKYTIDADKTIQVPPTKREDLLVRTITEALKVKKQGFDVWINIFAQDKSDAAEATDWSYLPINPESSNNATTVLINFIRRAGDRNIGIALFDR